MSEPIQQLQPTFSGGEFSPSLYSRTDLQKYATGLKTARNVYIHKHGGVSNRPGTSLRGSTKDHTKRFRLLPFVFSDTQAYVLEFGHLYIRFYHMQTGALIADPVTPTIPYEVVTPYTESDLRGLDITQSADTLFIVRGGTTKVKTLVRYDHANWVLSNYVPTKGPFMKSNLDEASLITPSAKTGASITLTAANDIFKAGHVGALWQLKQDVDGSATTVSTSGTADSASIGCGGTWRFITRGTWTGKVQIKRSMDSGATWQVLRTYQASSDTNHNVYGTESESCQVKLTATITSGTCNADLTTDAYTHTGIVEITAFTDTKHVTAKSVVDLGATTATWNWSEGAWSDVRGYPCAIAFYDQDRLCFAGTLSEPQTTWMTETGDYNSFKRSSPLVDTDGITAKLPSRRMNPIRSITNRGELIALTSDGVWTVGAPTGQVLSPTQVSTKQHEESGSADITPVVVGQRLVYVAAMGKSVKDTAYEFTSDGMKGDDLTIYSSHLFEHGTVVEMAYAPEPDSILWLVKDDGTMLSCTYLRDQQLLAWTRHDTDGWFETVCTIPGDSRHEVWVGVRRTINGQTKRTIERFENRLGNPTGYDANHKPIYDPAQCFFVDCGAIVTGTDITEVEGLDHLEGKMVSILADGNVMPRKLVVGGKVTLTRAASTVVVGLPFTSDIETLNIDYQGPSGTAQGRKMRVASATLRLLNSRGGYIGPDADNLTELLPRPIPDAPTPLFSGDSKENLDSSYGDEGHVFIRQSDPLPISIQAIIPNVTDGGTGG